MQVYTQSIYLKCEKYIDNIYNSLAAKARLLAKNHTFCETLTLCALWHDSIFLHSGVTSVMVTCMTECNDMSVK